MKRCAFCPTEATKLSGEHIWDDWLNDELPTKRFRVRQRKSTLEPFREYDACVLKEKLPVVCEKCNNTWMSDVTNRVKQSFAGMIISGAHVSLSRADTALLAAFAFMKSVVADHATPKPEPFFTRAARESFRVSLAIPAGVQIWMAAFQGDYRYSGKCTTAILTPNAPGPIDGIEFFTSTYVVGHLVLQTLALRWAHLHQLATSLPDITPGTDWNPATVQLWPDSSFPISWPPPKYLGENIIQRFIDRFNVPMHVSV